MMGQDEDATIDLIRELREASLEPVATAHNGEVLKRLGDGWIISFPSVDDAIRAALAAQIALSEHPKIHLRMGLHMGDIVVDDADIYGAGVNLAARLQTEAPPGGIMISADLYRQAARILTYYYNVESFEQILSWHHAAGDFVVRIDNADLDIKMISARAYAPLFTNLSHPKNGEKDVELILQALLIFFLNLSIRMRLDRYDGVGDIVWADRMAVQCTFDGFFDGLASKPTVASMPDSIDRCFRYYLSVCSQEDLFDLSKGVLKTFHRRAPEVQIVTHHLKEHVEELSRVIGQV